MQSASDFSRAIELDPSNKELQVLLQKSKDKYLEVEGKGEWKEENLLLESEKKVPESTYVSTPAIIEKESDFLSLLSSFSRFEVLSEGRYSKRITVTDLLQPAGSKKAEEKNERKSEDEKSRDGTTMNINSKGSENEFTRVAITFDDDSDSDEEVENDKEQSGRSKNRGDTDVNEDDDDNQTFTRINITEGSDSEEDIEKEIEIVIEKKERQGTIAVEEELQSQDKKEVEKEVKIVDTVKTSSFTRIVIEDDNDKDLASKVGGVENFVVSQEKEAQNKVEKKENLLGSKTGDNIENEAVHDTIHSEVTTGQTGKAVEVREKKIIADKKNETDDKNEENKIAASKTERENQSEALKLEGNEAMKSLNYQAALCLYTQSLELDQSNLLTRNNRSQAYLKLNQFKESAADATYILEHDPSYPLTRAGDKSTSALSSSTLSVPMSSTVKKALFRRATVSTVKLLRASLCTFFMFL